MSELLDLLVVGSGPAGMAAAIRARSANLNVLVVDDQPAPGGQIWRAVERTVDSLEQRVLDADYRRGADVVRIFRSCGASYEHDTSVWQIAPGLRVYLSHEGHSRVVEAANVLIATGARERPAPFPGWTTPGVLTAGAGQILLKSAHQVPASPTWIAGSGPLVVLFAKQLLDFGVHIDGVLDTMPSANRYAALPYLPKALMAYRDLFKGLEWLLSLRRAGIKIVHDVDRLEALGGDALQAVRYETLAGSKGEVPASTLFIHEGVIPNVHMTLGLGCEHAWNEGQMALAPVTDSWGETSIPGIFVAGDGAGVAGADAARLRGELAALRIAVRRGRLAEPDANQFARPIRRLLSRELALRPFLERLYRPRPRAFSPADETIICRCEEITAGQIRRSAMIGKPGPNQVKSFTRAGMGPCQGRTCGYAVAHILAEHHQVPVQSLGLFRVRPPFAPISLGELASMDTGQEGK